MDSRSNPVGDLNLAGLPGEATLGATQPPSPLSLNLEKKRKNVKQTTLNENW
jgi:hypothetical protein